MPSCWAFLFLPEVEWTSLLIRNEVLPLTAEAMNTRFDAFKNHEMIHLYQARSTHDSWLCFYARYFVFWLRACRYRKHLKNAGYLLNPFEMEAYAHMHDLDYLSDKPDGCTGWKAYARLSLDERLDMLTHKKTK